MATMFSTLSEQARCCTPFTHEALLSFGLDLVLYHSEVSREVRAAHTLQHCTSSIGRIILTNACR
jgi:hypothetical protein